MYWWAVACVIYEVKPNITIKMLLECGLIYLLMPFVYIMFVFMVVDISIFALRGFHNTTICTLKHETLQ